MRLSTGCLQAAGLGLLDCKMPVVCWLALHRLHISLTRLHHSSLCLCSLAVHVKQSSFDLCRLAADVAQLQIKILECPAS